MEHPFKTSFQNYQFKSFESLIMYNAGNSIRFSPPLETGGSIPSPPGNPGQPEPNMFFFFDKKEIHVFITNEGDSLDVVTKDTDIQNNGKYSVENDFNDVAILDVSDLINSIYMILLYAYLRDKKSIFKNNADAREVLTVTFKFKIYDSKTMDDTINVFRFNTLVHKKDADLFKFDIERAGNKSPQIEILFFLDTKLDLLEIHEILKHYTTATDYIYTNDQTKLIKDIDFKKHLLLADPDDAGEKITSLYERSEEIRNIFKTFSPGDSIKFAFKNYDQLMVFLFDWISTYNHP